MCSISSGESARTGVRAEKSAIPAKGDCGLSDSAMVRSYSETQTRSDFANWRGGIFGTGAHSREQRPTVSGGVRPPNVPFVTRARKRGEPKFDIFFSYRSCLDLRFLRARE